MKFSTAATLFAAAVIGGSSVMALPALGDESVSLEAREPAAVSENQHFARELTLDLSELEVRESDLIDELDARGPRTPGGRGRGRRSGGGGRRRRNGGKRRANRRKARKAAAAAASAPASPTAESPAPEAASPAPEGRSFLDEEELLDIVEREPLRFMPGAIRRGGFGGGLPSPRRGGFGGLSRPRLGGFGGPRRGLAGLGRPRGGLGLGRAPGGIRRGLRAASPAVGARDLMLGEDELIDLAARGRGKGGKGGRRGRGKGKGRGKGRGKGKGRRGGKRRLPKQADPSAGAEGAAAPDAGAAPADPAAA